MNMNWGASCPPLQRRSAKTFPSIMNFSRHCLWLIDNGCKGIVALGSLGEGATLTSFEKIDVLRTCIEAAGGRAPVVAGISALSTADAVALAKAAQHAGCSGLMVLPPYVYLGDWRENKAHVSAVFSATDLSCMLLQQSRRR